MMARKHSKHGPYEDFHLEADAPAPVVSCWLCGRPTGKTIVWHHPVPKSRGGQEVVPMNPLCQKTLLANFHNSELTLNGKTGEATDRERVVTDVWIAERGGH